MQKFFRASYLHKCWNIVLKSISFTNVKYIVFMLLLIDMANVLPKKEKKKRINKLSLIDREGVTINER